MEGVVASLISTTCCYPLDFIKTQVQTSNASSSGVSGSITSLRNASVMRGKWRHVYKGLPAELTGTLPSAYVYWKTFDVMREQKYNTFSSSIVAAITSNLIDTPFDVRKKQRQLFFNDNTKVTNIRLISKFFAVNCLHSCTYNAIYMPLLEYLLNDRKMNKTLAIFCCCTTASIATYGIDRWRTQIVYERALPSRWWQGLLHRVLLGNLYSGLYMHILLWMKDEVI